MSHPTSRTLFRSTPWLQAWIETYGNDPALKLIDLGGRKDPLDYVYLTTAQLKGVLPVNSLCLAGMPYAKIDTPRAEYLNHNMLMSDNAPFADEIKRLNPHQICIADIDTSLNPSDSLRQVASRYSRHLFIQKKEQAYSIEPTEFETYLSTLSASTRRSYFNQRKKLDAIGKVELTTYPVEDAALFFSAHNQLHRLRWGIPCYSDRTQSFLQSFMTDLIRENGLPIMQTMSLNGEVIATLFDISWQGRRYNFQSCFKSLENSNLAVGSLMLGHAIEESLRQHQAYDLMAGRGKNSAYKSLISTTSTELYSISLMNKPLYQLVNTHRLIKNKLQGLRP
ncbi:GNAT family N-acetyltransferase [Oceanicoccus sagamiensis]|uniref:BioF2-like acetyltransferase domain-containing protein n=1 Tax=Oceanicoccus sagamiensis TaxID=716816 RepID=A0A1X9N8W6_9GAMM|nr:GNAT family N-acetyltransferase [Oceanicoccus sagamiensis]ARN74518.1 hypothetical protein BST96_10540 [Oceanicoccus sagamiensis]